MQQLSMDINIKVETLMELLELAKPEVTAAIIKAIDELGERKLNFEAARLQNYLID